MRRFRESDRKIVSRLRLSKVADKIARGKARASEHGDNWQEVDIDDAAKKLAPGSTPEQKDGKIIYTNAEGTVAIVANHAAVIDEYEHTYDVKANHAWFDVCLCQVDSSETFILAAAVIQN